MVIGMSRLTKKIKGANNYCGYEVKNATYKELFDLKSNSQIEDEVNCDLTIAIDKFGKLEDLEEEYNANEEDIERALILKKIIENGYVYYEDDYGEGTYYIGGELMFDFRTNEIVLSEEYDDDYLGRWEEIARFPILDYKKKYWLRKDKSE